MPVPGGFSTSAAAGPFTISYRMSTGVSTMAAQIGVATITSPIRVLRAFVVAEEAFAPNDAAWSQALWRVHDADESSPRVIVAWDTKETGGNGMTEITTAFFEGGANPQDVGSAATYENLDSPFTITPDVNTPSVVTFQVQVGGGGGAAFPKGLYVLECEYA
jgi:hypothetical protein